MSDQGFFGPAVVPSSAVLPPPGAPMGWAPPAPTGSVVPPPSAPAPGGRGRLVAMVLCGVAVLGVALAVSLLFLRGSGKPPNVLAEAPLEAGECLTVIPSGGQAPQPVLCTMPHTGEVFGVIPVAGAQGISGTAAQVAACTGQLGEFLLGDPPAGVRVLAIQPGEPGRIVCVLTGGPTPVTGSLQGTGTDGTTG